MNSERNERAFDFWFSLLATLAIFAPLLVYGTHDEESYSLGVFSTEAFWRQLFSFKDPFWISDYGTGILAPSGDWLVLNLFTAFSNWSGPRIIYGTTWILGGFCASFFAMRLLRRWEVGALTRVAAAITVLLSSPALAYSYVNDWPDTFSCWTLSFAALWALLRVFHAQSPRDLLLSTVLLALAAGFMAANSPAGAGFVMAYVLVIVAAVLIAHRPRMVLPFGIAASVVALMAAPMLYAWGSQIFGEFGSLPYRNRPSLDIVSIVDLGLQPLSYVIKSGDISWDLLANEPYGYRAIFFGGVFLAAALVATIAVAVGAWRDHDKGWRIGAMRALAVGFVAALGLVFAPHALALNMIAGMWLFRDPLTVLGIILAAIAISRIRSGVLRNSLLGLQVLQMFIAGAPLITKQFGDPGRATVFSYDADAPFFALLREAGIPKGARISMAGDLARDARSRIPGLVASSDLLRQGYAIVNDVWWRALVVPNLSSVLVS